MQQIRYKQPFPGPELQSFYEAAERYEGMREFARAFAQSEFQKRIALGEPRLLQLAGRSLDLGPINPPTLTAAWPSMVFPWGHLHAAFRSYLKRFEIAIWADEIVQALAYGRPSEGPQHLNLHFIERRKDDRSCLSGCAALLITDAAEAYAKVLGKEKLRLKNPLPNAVPTYMRLGFVDDGRTAGVPYMMRKVRP